MSYANHMPNLVNQICQPNRQQIQRSCGDQGQPHSPAEGPDDHSAVPLHLEGDDTQEVVDVDGKGKIDHSSPVLVDYEGA